MTSEELQRALFLIQPKSFGDASKLLVAKYLGGIAQPDSSPFDVDWNGNRAELKMARVRGRAPQTIRDDNLTGILGWYAQNFDRAVPFGHATKTPFTADFMYIKPSLFDVLVYGLFFKDAVLLFSADAGRVGLLSGWRESPGRFHDGNCAIHLTNTTLKWHVDNQFYSKASYGELLMKYQPEIQPLTGRELYGALGNPGPHHPERRPPHLDPVSPRLGLQGPGREWRSHSPLAC
jgi:hypothetical protein